jgi:hypothetical protein
MIKSWLSRELPKNAYFWVSSSRGDRAISWLAIGENLSFGSSKQISETASGNLVAACFIWVLRCLAAEFPIFLTSFF